MSERRRLFDAYQDASRLGINCGLVTVIATEGSTFRKPGARMLVTAQSATGMVAGGCFDGQIRERTLEVMKSCEASVVVWDSRADDDVLFGTGLGCKGKTTLFIEPLPLGLDRADLELYLPDHEQEAELFLGIVVKTPAGRKDLLGKRLRAQNVSSGNGNEGLTIGSEQPGCCVFWERRPPVPRLMIFGAGEDAVEVSQLAANMGWVVVVVDPRESLLTKARFGTKANLHQCHPETFFLEASISSRDALLIMNHHYERDKATISCALATDACYVGLLGPRKRGESLIREIGYSTADFARQCGIFSRFFTPCGISLGGRDPSAVALSIVAEIQAILSGSALGHLRVKEDHDVDVPEKTQSSGDYFGGGQVITLTPS